MVKKTVKPASRPPGRPKKHLDLRKRIVSVLRTLRGLPPANNSTTPRPGQRGPNRWIVSYAEIRKALGVKVHNERLISACKGLKRIKTRKLRLPTLSQEEMTMSDSQWRGYGISQGQQGW